MKFILFFQMIAAIALAATTDGQEDICNDAAVLMCENFENRALGSAKSSLGSSKFKNNGWGVSSETGMSIVSNEKFDGSKSLMWTFPENGSAGFLDSAFTANRTVYYRWHMKNSLNWKWSANGNKMVFMLGPVDRLVMFDQGLFRGSTPAFLTTYSSPEPPNRYPNVSAFNWPNDGSWVCIEMKITVNSTSLGTDGAVQGWINNVLSYDYPNINISTKDTLNSLIMPSGYWNCKTGQHPTCDYSDPDNQHPLMYRWIDNIVVSKQRIGCGTTSATPALKPAAPNNLRIINSSSL